jgi:hypothetical protein
MDLNYEKNILDDIGYKLPFFYKSNKNEIFNTEYGSVFIQLTYFTWFNFKLTRSYGNIRDLSVPSGALSPIISG